MDKDASPPKARVTQVRLLLWLLVAIAVIGTAALLLARRAPVKPPEAASANASFGGPFTLVGSDGKPFSSAALKGKPYAIFFGFTRCGDVCPMTLSRLARLRRAAAAENALNIVFVTIDPKHDGPKEVGQYASLFNTPIIGLTGTDAQIDAVKKQYGIYAEPTPHAAQGQEMQHTSTVLLFDRDGGFAATIAPDESDTGALAKMKRIIG